MTSDGCVPDTDDCTSSAVGANVHGCRALILYSADAPNRRYVEIGLPRNIPLDLLTSIPGVLVINDTFSLTLTRDAVFEPSCTGGVSGIIHGFSDNATVLDWRDPFYASVSPQIYALAAATVVSYVLVIMLYITPRTFFVGGPGGGSGLLSTRVLLGTSNANSNVVGVGRRPWLQKIAAISVSISLTIATADTFRVAERQYLAGFSDSGKVVEEVAASLEIRIVRVVSDTFLWLAQVQTLIRLFPRHKEKVVIKWLGFALIVLDTIFSVLNNFVYMSTLSRPRTYQDAVPALSYLFELAIGLIYASCIIYFAMSKRRFAIWHPRMRNICLVALLSFTSVLIPVVFFITDITKPDLAGWGDYIRWVGAAAASVVVWEWVERIEALERDELKDGILGREIFDDDEMLDVTPSQEVGGRGNGNDQVGKGGSGTATRRRRPIRSRIRFASQNKVVDGLRAPSPVADRTSMAHRVTSPPTTATPISRADTTSAASTQYAVRYHTIASPSPPSRHLSQTETAAATNNSESSTSDRTSIDAEKGLAIAEPEPQRPPGAGIALAGFGQTMLRAVPNPFKRRKASPPTEVADAMRQQNKSAPSPPSVSGGGNWNLVERIGAFTTTQREKLISHLEGRVIDTTLPVTIIPAQPRGQRTWSPEDFDIARPASDRQKDQARNEPRLPALPNDTSSPQMSRRSSIHRNGRSEEDGDDDDDPPATGFSDSTLRGDSTSLLTAGRENRVVSRRGTLTISEVGAHTNASPQRSPSNARYLSTNFSRPRTASPGDSANDSSEAHVGQGHVPQD